MKKKNLCLFLFSIGTLLFSNCDTEVEPIQIQELKTYDEQYYHNLREYKKSDHEISFAYYEAWSPIEGVDGYKDPASWGERMVGLPDSIDIVNLWMGIPMPDTHPIAYADMKYCQEKLGTRFVMHADASHYRHVFTVDGVEYDMSNDRSDEMMAAYAKYIVNQYRAAGLDGVDVDWEGWSAADIVRLCEQLSAYCGPLSPNPQELLIVDYFSGHPPTAIEPYCDYIVQQAYSNQVGFLSEPTGFPSEKMVYCETFGVYYLTGGKLLDYAKWQPTRGARKGGCGVFFLGRNYYSASGIPYNEFRQAIQIMNPAIHE